MERVQWILILISQIKSTACNICIETVKHLRFYTRFHISKLYFENDPYAPPDFSVSVRSLPLAAAIMVLPGTLFIGIGAAFGLAPLVVATLVTGASALVTGAFHEDGLADTADSVGGGYSIEKRLTIMRDSRIGSYGAVALIFVILLKITALSQLISGSAVAAACVFLSAAMVSRVAGILPLMFLPAARMDGKSASVKNPQFLASTVAIIITVIFCFISLKSFGAIKIISALCVVGFLTFVVCLWSWRKINGQTGDVLGAIQQISETAFLVVLSAGS